MASVIYRDTSALTGKKQRGKIKPGGAALLFDSFQLHCLEGRYLEIPWGEDIEQQARRVLDNCRRMTPPLPLRSLGGLHLGAVLAAGIQTIISTDILLCSAAKSLGLNVL